MSINSAWAGNPVYIQLQGTSSGEPHEANAVPYVAYNSNGWSNKVKTTVLNESNGWGFYDMPDDAFDIYRGNNSGTCWDKLIYTDQGAGIYYVYKEDGTVKISRTTTWTAGWENADPDNNRWVQVYATGGTTNATATDTKYDTNVGSTVTLYLKEFGAWVWKNSNGNVGEMTLHFKMAKIGSPDTPIGDWNTIDHNAVVSNEKDGKTYQAWKWTGDENLLDMCTGDDKVSLTSGNYKLEFYYTAQMNRATGDATCPETSYFSRNGSNYFILFSIPAPQVTISGRPYAGIESIVTAAPKANTTIDGQTLHYKFEHGHGDSWSEVQGYSTTATCTYTPSSTTDNIRVKMKVVDTGEESDWVVQDVYEQYYIYVEDTRNWGQMWEAMKNTDNDTYYLNRGFPGEKLMACDTIDEKPIYRVTLDSYFHRLWLSVGENSKQTYNDGFPINYDLGETYGIKKQHAGNWYQLCEGGGPNDCYLKDYPTAIFRVVSYDGATGKTYYSNAISPTEGTGTVSFFANPANGSSTVKIQTWSQGGTGDGAQHIDGTWNTAGTNYISSCSDVSATGTVFTATLSSSSLTNFAKYTGDYDIHVYANTENNLAGGVAKGGVGTKFTYFEPNTTIFGTEDYNHYWVDWFPKGEDISCVGTVGNIYNSDLAGVISTDPYSPDGQIKSANGGNVRFAYNPSTNYFKRTIIAGSGSEIKIQGAHVNANGAGKGNKSSFSDASDWVYTASAVIDGEATATITTSYNGYEQTLAADKQLMGGDLASTYNVLITYDYKTNRLLAAWKPEGAFEGFNLESNLIVVRTENGNPTVLNMVDGEDAGSDVTDLSGISKIYVALELLRDSWTNKDSESPAPYATRRIDAGSYCDEYYWISLPYDCNIRDIFGIEGYGSSWVIQTYHGDYRAQKGWWAEQGSWWYNMDHATGVMKANQGYVLRVTNLNADHGGTRRFANEDGAKLYLYFPSAGSNLTLEEKGASTTTTVPEHKCTIWRGKENNPQTNEGNPSYDRRAIDSNWNIIGSPSFNSAKISTTGWGTSYPTSPNVKGDLKFFYEWAANGDPKYTVNTSVNSFEFQATHAYLVQYAGTLTWEPFDSDNPLVGKKAPARYNEESADQTLKLVLNRDGQQTDVTYISRMAEGATEGYDLNLDLSKLMSKTGNNLYTIVGFYKMAGNCLPDTVSIVPVGVQLATAGEYTFSMPDGTKGTGVTLVDNVAHTRTNLALMDYTLDLPAGTHEGRFTLELSPIAQNPTDIRTIGNEGSESGVRKVIVDGLLYIVKEGVAYDARGNRVK